MNKLETLKASTRLAHAGEQSGSNAKAVKKQSTAVLANSPQAYKTLGIKDGSTELWEDGMRTHGKENSYEWWYIDAEFESGLTAVIVFYTKNIFDVDGPAHPTVTLNLTYPDGKEKKYTVQEKVNTKIRAAKDKGDVAIGDSYLRYVDGGYELHFTDGDEVNLTLDMKSDLPMWRPDTGHWYFGEKAENYFAWIVAQPSSTITGSLILNGKESQLQGHGYHDHNWGNIGMNKVMNHWYWGRATIGDYNVIAVDIVSSKSTGYTRLPVFMISKDGKILDDDQSKTVITRSDTIEHPETGKFYDNHLTYVQSSDDGTTYTIKMKRERDISVVNLLDTTSTFKRWIGKAIGANPTYIRTLGEVTLTVEKDGQTEHLQQEGLWEQMFFGNNKDAVIWN